jgi:hypothetical protein
MVQTVTVGSPPRDITAVTVALVVAVLALLAQPTGLHGVARGVLDLLLTAVRLLGLTLTLLTCTALGWVILKLMSRNVRRACG